ncbi:YigZ family protein [Pantoea sp. M_5]|uniref:YigZ family protein n=1 Tax=Pantoea sp. M_5 TaxID=2608038 RepID=UPI00351B1758
MEAFDIPAVPVSSSEETIKKSRFITLLAHTEGAEAARAFVQQVKSEHPAARHHCFRQIFCPQQQRQNGALLRLCHQPLGDRFTTP